MSKLKIFFLAIVSFTSLNGYAHGNFPMPSCFLGGNFFANSNYKCKISFSEFPNNGGHFIQLKEFDFAEILSGKVNQWKTDDGIVARYTTTKGSKIIVSAVVSCPLEGKSVDPNVIDLQVYVEDKVEVKKSYSDDVSLFDVSILPGRQLRAAFSIEERSAEVICTVR